MVWLEFGSAMNGGRGVALMPPRDQYRVLPGAPNSKREISNLSRVSLRSAVKLGASRSSHRPEVRRIDLRFETFADQRIQQETEAAEYRRALGVDRMPRGNSPRQVGGQVPTAAVGLEKYPLVTGSRRSIRPIRLKTTPCHVREPEIRSGTTPNT